MICQLYRDKEGIVYGTSQHQRLYARWQKNDEGTPRLSYDCIVCGHVFDLLDYKDEIKGEIPAPFEKKEHLLYEVPCPNCKEVTLLREIQCFEKVGGVLEKRIKSAKKVLRDLEKAKQRKLAKEKCDSTEHIIKMLTTSYGIPTTKEKDIGVMGIGWSVSQCIVCGILHLHTYAGILIKEITVPEARILTRNFEADFSDW